MGYNNGAYDLSLFSQRSPYVRATANVGTAQAKKNSSKSRKPGTSAKAPTSLEEERERIARHETITKLARVLVVGMLAAIAVTVFIGNRVEDLELTRQIENANATLVGLQQDYEALRVDFDNKMSDAAVEEYAVNVLGMQKRENGQTEYISLGVGSVFEIGDEQSFDWYQTNLENILSYGD